MGDDVMRFGDIDRTMVAAVGGKGANLGELSRIDGVTVPPGFCVTTDVFRRAIDALDRLVGLDPEDHGAISERSAEVRSLVESVDIPDGVAASVAAAIERLGAGDAYAVRSSATAEDQPTASFAGQHDSYLGVVGASAVLDHVRRCWASLFTERAVSYRIRHGIDHRSVHMAVVVQRMVDADVSGVMFTADPRTGDRRAVSIEAVAGLGEALVSGRVAPDTFEVRGSEVVASSIATADRTLTDAQAVELAQLGRRIEAHFGDPQDVEWCLADGRLLVVQSRPITTLFPVPESVDGGNHVYVSVGHQQMMTDAMTPLGLSVWQLTTPRPMAEAGSRLFVDVTPLLASPATRAGIVAGMGSSDPLLGDALQSVVDRADFLPVPADDAPTQLPRGLAPEESLEADPAIVTDLMGETDASLAELRERIAPLAGPDLVDFIVEDFGELRRLMQSPRSAQVYMSAMNAATWLNDQLLEWLGEKNAADVLTQSVPNNVTSEMGLALLAVADVVRPHPEVVAFLEHVDDAGFLDQLPSVPGGEAVRDAIVAFLDRYGMRCAGEIDITRPRWSERPSTLVPVILDNVRLFDDGEGERRFEQGRREAEAKAEELLARLRSLPDGEAKADETERAIARLRTFIGYREHPKYGMVSRYFVYKQALMAEAGRLVAAGVLDDPEDLFFLRLQELQEVVRTGVVHRALIRRRRSEYEAHRSLTPPRVLTSDGEAVAGSYKRDDVPPDALVGLGVSAGTVEGRARVILDIAEADLGPEDILVTSFTDPSWTPLFVAIVGLVTEVGGLMTHGAVVAREYGLPAVVGVEHATRLIRDGQRIRVHGTDGYIELLD